MTLSRKHYQAMADVIQPIAAKAVREGGYRGEAYVAVQDITVGMAQMFKADNPRFNPERFFEAARVK